MSRYRCKSCGYGGEVLVYQFTDYTHCLASNDESPVLAGDAPEWVEKRSPGDAAVGEPVGCPRCRAWGVGNFETA